MSSPNSGYFARLTQVCWSFFLSIFSSRHRKQPALPELPTSSPVATHPATLDSFAPGRFRVQHDAPYDGLASWQEDKQQFLRRPSLLKASMVRDRTQEPRKKRHRTMAPPPPQIYVQDWSSLGLNMSDFFDPPSAARLGAAQSATAPSDPSDATGAELAPSLPPVEHPNDVGLKSTELSASQSIEILLADDLTSLPDTTPSNTEADSTVIPKEEPQEASAVVESATLSFTAGRYEPNALSAVSGPLWDPPSFLNSYSTPLPDTTPAGPKSAPKSTSNNRRDSMLPYCDLFDFQEYFGGDHARGISGDSFCESFELPLISVSGRSEKKSVADSLRRISVYDVVRERDRYRSAAYTSCLFSACSSEPRRAPLTSTLNLRSGRDTADFSSPLSKKSDASCPSTGIGETTSAQFTAACDELSRFEWTEEEFLTMLTAV
ncbi:hypothetical protein DFH07DRAFT_946940 [Mycena maculata]|uniref:Uncharacterized protein n=1 Tax=Mycena maculata TaxID=230809 RepID=A0AAD7HJF5_9AGAR|nr:hypothetical protein DFH07DRAFT_946940 [Mycena maculata]